MKRPDASDLQGRLGEWDDLLNKLIDVERLGLLFESNRYLCACG